MKEQLKALYELQALDIRITRVKAALAAAAPSKALKDKLDLTEAKLGEADKALSAAETELRDSELKLRSIDEKRVNFEKRLYSGSVTNPKELSSIEKEISLLKSQQKGLDGRTLELYDVVENARVTSKSLRDDVEKLNAQLQEAQGRESEERAKLEAQLTSLTAERAEEVGKVTDKALMSRYETVRSKTGNTGIAKVADGRCEGCRVAVTTFTIRNLLADNAIELCENCHRILLLDIE